MPVTYFAFLQKHFTPEIGVYHSYDLVAYKDLSSPPMAVLQDVTPDFDLALRMTQTFNKLELSPLHLMDAVLDMLG